MTYLVLVEPLQCTHIDHDLDESLHNAEYDQAVKPDMDCQLAPGT